MWPRSWFTGKYPWARGAAVEARGSARCAVPSGCACGELLVGGGALGLTQADGRAQAAGAGGVATGLDTVHGKWRDSDQPSSPSMSSRYRWGLDGGADVDALGGAIRS